MRLENKFNELKQQGRAGLITYIMAYDKSLEESQKILNGLPEAGADIIELGMPFSDPMADGPVIQAAGIRALKAGAKVSGILKMVEQFRKNNDSTPIVLMGYYNPVRNYGVEKFCADANKAGVDAVLIVDLPIEEDDELFEITKKYDIANIKLATPTTDNERMKLIAKKAGGFLYYVAVTGVTGVKSASYESVGQAVERIKQNCDLPIAVGFGIKTTSDVKSVGKYADAVVVGSSIVNKIKDSSAEEVLNFVSELAIGNR
ncbi:MAG: tryptophan synthase subunit alpha [Alphaproteobacteria bacterium CG11_big_fil_rev_8_21_14_0_20_39_49]|nr:MAG: tryptophan synthase subunit alpha [Alphaproteobacteria bacterium CG11_big_fil_rev_8_21_14_0_20_39_49]